MKRLLLLLLILLASPMLLMAQPAFNVAMPNKDFTVGVATTTDSKAVCVKQASEDIRISFQTLGELLLHYNVKRDDLGNYQIDRLIPASLGGSDDARNLWLQPYVPNGIGAKQKDQLEAVLYKKVCAGEMKLVDAQQLITTNWYTAYLQHVPQKAKK